MKLHKYGKSVKFAAVAAEVILATICVVCVGIVSCNAVISVPNRANSMNVNYYISPFSKTASFEDSDVFSDMIYDNLNNVIRYCVIRGQLEEDGQFAETKEIDIEQFARHFEELPVTDTSICYRLGDLLQWGQSEGMVTIQTYPYEEAQRMIVQAWEKEIRDAGSTDRESADTTGSEQEVLVEAEIYEEPASEAEYVSDQEQDMVAVEIVLEEEADEERYVQIPVERYLPVDGRSILAHVGNVEELEEMVFYLEETVRMLRENYISYREYREYFDKKESNFSYYIRKENGTDTEVYTNVQALAENADTENIEDYFGSMGRNISFKPADFTYETNTSIREEQVRYIWNDYRYAYPDDTSVWIGVDTAFTLPDDFQSAEMSYRTAAPGYLFILLSVCCGIAAFVLFGLTTHMAGKKLGTEGITLIWFDRWYTEIAASVAMGITGTLFFVTGLAVSELYWGSMGDHLRMLGALGLGTALTFGMFLFFWLSLVRRIKAGTFWKNFLLYRIFLKCRTIIMTIYDDSRIVIRVWVPYALFVALNVCLIRAGGTFAALTVDFFVGIFLYRGNRTRKQILEGIGNIRNGDLDYQIDVEKIHGENRILAEAVNSIGNGIRQAVETSVKDERMKADLITNVSHDIKTPLTSIINYVDLIKREPVENERIKGYLEVLDNKSQRLKQLTEDLVEVSKISSGNIVLQCEQLDLRELMKQTIGEFSERFEEKDLKLVVSMEEQPLLIHGDSRRIWRVMENLFNNAYKYALKHTRVYVELKELKEESGAGRVRLSVKNISAQPLNIGVEDLTERFIRGDVSRSTEGSGLGLSIAKNLTELQKGRFEIISDGDLFKVVITFPLVV